MSDTCRSCGAPVIWGVSYTGRRMIFDAEPAPDGEWYFEPGPRPDEPRAIGVGRSGALPLLGDGRLYRSHFATCPDAEEWRRKRNG